MAKRGRPEGSRQSPESREAIGLGVRNAAITRKAALSEALDFRDRVMQAARETPELPVCEVIRLMPPLDQEEEEEE